MELNGSTLSQDHREVACKALLQCNPVLQEIDEIEDLDDFLNKCKLPRRYELTKGPELGDTDWIIAIYDPIEEGKFSHLCLEEKTHYFACSASFDILDEIQP